MPDALQFKIHGMDCAEEVNILKRELRDLVGNESNLSFDILNGRMTLRDAGRLSAQQVIERVARTGMSAELWTGAGADCERGPKPEGGGAMLERP